MNAQTIDDPDGPDHPDNDDGDAAPPLLPLGVTVEVADSQSHLAVDPALIDRLVRDVLAGEGVHWATISVALVDDAAIHALNRRFLNHDWPTDVITFPLSEGDEPVLAGELVVSAEMAAATARAAGVAPWDELALYLVHGLLHLLGFDDSADDDRQVMRRREEEVLSRLGLTNTFPASAVAESGARERARARWTV